eukprot:5905663-Pleurochrysis_carterae.AAC.3
MLAQARRPSARPRDGRDGQQRGTVAGAPLDAAGGRPRRAQPRGNGETQPTQPLLFCYRIGMAVVVAAAFS